MWMQGNSIGGQMKAKKYLMQLQSIHNSIERRKIELEEVRALAESVGSFDYSRDVVDTSKTGDALERKVMNIVDKEFEYLDTITLYLEKKNQIITEIESIDDGTDVMFNYSNLLYKKYVEFKSLELISCEMGYSHERIKHIHGEALVCFENKILAPNSTE